MRLSKKHVAVIKMLAYTGASKREVALTNSISEQTLYNWLRDESFKKALEEFKDRYAKAIEEYSESSVDREQLFNILGINEDEEWMVREIIDETLMRPAVSNEQKEKINRILDKAFDVIERRLDDNTADTALLNFIVEKFAK